MEDGRLTKRIFLISNMWPDASSPGYGSFVKNVADGLRQYGFNTVRKAIIVGRPHGKLGKLRAYMKFYGSIIKGFFGKFDFIYIHFPNHAVPLLKLLYLFRQPRIVVNYHGEDLLYIPNGYTGMLGRMTEKFVSRHASAVVVPSEYYKSIVKEKKILADDRIIVSPSGGISSEVFYPRDVSQAIGRVEEIRPILLGYVGRLEPEKGILVFLETLKILKERGFDFNARIIGYGTQMECVKNFVRKESMEERVTIIPGIPQDQLGNHYRAMDLLIFPSMNESESLGLTGIEAMACGTPVVGSEIGGIATYLKDGVNGFLVPPGDAYSCADAVIRYKFGACGMVENMKKGGSMQMPRVIPGAADTKKDIIENAIKTGCDYYSRQVCEELGDNLRRMTW